MPEGKVSTRLSDDAASAYYRFRTNARTLGAISTSFHELADGMTSAYYNALTHEDMDAWSMLVAQAAALLQRAQGLDGIAVFDLKDREALDFFAAIVRENADLLTIPSAMAAGVNVAEVLACV